LRYTVIAADATISESSDTYFQSSVIVFLTHDAYMHCVIDLYAKVRTGVRYSVSRTVVLYTETISLIMRQLTICDSRETLFFFHSADLYKT